MEEEIKEVEVLEDYDGDDEQGHPVVWNRYYCPYCGKRVDARSYYVCSHCGKEYKTRYLDFERDIEKLEYILSKIKAHYNYSWQKPTYENKCAKALGYLVKEQIERVKNENNEFRKLNKEVKE